MFTLLDVFTSGCWIRDPESRILKRFTTEICPGNLGHRLWWTCSARWSPIDPKPGQMPMRSSGILRKSLLILKTRLCLTLAMLNGYDLSTYLPILSMRSSTISTLSENRKIQNWLRFATICINNINFKLKFLKKKLFKLKKLWRLNWKKKKTRNLRWKFD